MENRAEKFLEKVATLENKDYEFSNKFTFKLNFDKLLEENYRRFGETLEERINFILELFNRKILVEGFYEKR